MEEMSRVRNMVEGQWKVLWPEFVGKEEHTSQQLPEPETTTSTKEWYWESSAEWEERVLEKGDTLRLGSHCEVAIIMKILVNSVGVPTCLLLAEK